MATLAPREGKARDWETRNRVEGKPDVRHVNTSFVERQNLTMRMSIRRFTCLTSAFSKNLENHSLSVALHYMNYDLCRIHKVLRVTPAMAAGVTDHVWESAHKLIVLVLVAVLHLVRRSQRDQIWEAVVDIGAFGPD